MPKLLPYPCIAILLWMLASCQKETAPTVDNAILKKTTIKSGDSLFYEYFINDSQGNLVSILDSDNNGHSRTRQLLYDQQGRLASVTDRFDLDPVFTYSFQYDNNNRIIKKLLSGTTLRHSYAYDALGRLIADTMMSYWSGDISRYTSYAYNQIDNIIEKMIFLNTGSVFQMEQDIHSQFDTKPNPCYHPGNLLYFAAGDEDGNDYILSRNNPVSRSFDDGTVVTFSYQYYSNGLPKSYAMTDNTDPLIIYGDFYY